MKKTINSFIAGFVSTLIFHQGLLGIFYILNILKKAPYDMTAVAPLGVPSVISLAFFGGIWGILIYLLIKRALGKTFWIKSIIYGALGPTAVAIGVVFPMKGIEFKPIMIVFGLLLNAAWGLGNGLFIKLLNERTN